ncbi:signal recognition particle protein [Parafannyhessea umbonata]|jgi:signal recognition particle subunit SRP54|uniref:Signal recognition particle protein n=1 Tax=Parafannyhessea umbonata TaxID=604330 RepID=A0A6N7WVH8_9ACTN|nr:signal recognition particle protein [Parafannyhessea umbonata]MCI6681828.1 signal recognition particle protein [Parafannyhessea umbonata]MCI7218127.1 signal recognition particle protein [Parafannyhessea umbonata]MDD6601777.1 signal recognition particle protein [Parafannyhessea umbonata]MDD7199750.1 signal recognition particle protein [Parafannyhessea umbonata]MDY4418478.1 signal recognition particle protein [Parafannyhessea umbonata]
MFNSLSDRLQDTFGKLRGKGRLTEDDINTAMREIRMALLEADVNYRVVKKFVAECKEKCMTAEVLDSLSPAQNVVRIVLDQLTELLGTTESKLVLAQNRTPNVIMLVGLQGSGKTTAAAKLAYLLKRQGHSPLLAACDVHRPAAADQLETLGNEIGVKVYRGDGKDAVKVARESIQSAVDGLNDIVIVDTAGRLQIDEQMMQEAVDIKNAVKPDQVLMVVDAMTGQDIVNVVSEFANRVDFDGVIMSKLDGDARGGGALSVREVTGKPIKFVSMGEKPDSLEVFHPDRMAKRILGMGDVVSIIEEAQRVTDQKDIDDAERMLREGFTMDDMLTQMQQIRKMGGLKKILASLPGGERALEQAGGAVSDEQITRIEAMIHSMTKQERAKPKTINGQRRKRIAKGSGRSVQEVNQLLKQWSEMDKMMGKMRQLTNGGGNSRKARRQMTNMMRNMGMGGGMGGKMPF